MVMWLFIEVQSVNDTININENRVLPPWLIKLIINFIFTSYFLRKRYFKT